MKTFALWTLCLTIPLIAVFIESANLSNVVYIACQRNPYLNLCSLKSKHSSSAENFPDSEPPPNKANKLTQNKDDNDGSDFLPNIKGKEKNISVGDKEKAELTTFPDINESSKRIDAENLHEDDDHFRVSSTSKSWHNKDDEEPDTVLTRDGNFARINNEDVKTRNEAYCEKYQENYDYYCQDSIDKTPALKTHLLKFCPSFEANCPDKIKKKPGTSSITSFPTKTPEITDNTEKFPDVLNVVKSPQEIAAEERLAKLKKRFPCKPNCDVRIHKHCTAECKCDYSYPHVQRFCNPPPIPFFLNTCRLWYYGCPKYQGYHYASQFVYSKAEKGKTVGGVSPRIGNYGGATATGFGGGNGPVAGINPETPS